MTTLTEAINLMNCVLDYGVQAEMARSDPEAHYIGKVFWIVEFFHLHKGENDQLIFDIMLLPEFEDYLGNYAWPDETSWRYDEPNWNMDHPQNLAHILLRIYVDYLNGKLIRD